jgi:hypothetical protein
MRIFIFKSEVDRKLRAFAGDLLGSKLPDQFRPWRAVGAIAPENEPPHQLPRAHIEQAINDHGFQLWRIRPKATVA